MARQAHIDPARREQWLQNQARYTAALVALGITQAQSAELLRKLGGGRPVAARTVRSWLNNIETATASYCPDWAVSLLEKHAQSKVGKRARAG